MSDYSMSEGQRAFEALRLSEATGLQPPAWAIAAIVSCYEDFAIGCPDAGWTAAAMSTKAPRTLGEAFGIADHPKQHMLTRRTRAFLLRLLLPMFEGKAKLPRTLAGRQEAAHRLGITEKQVRTLLPKTRSNVRGHKPYGARAAPAFSANDPFALALKEVPKR